MPHPIVVRSSLSCVVLAPPSTVTGLLHYLTIVHPYYALEVKDRWHGLEQQCSSCPLVPAYMTFFSEPRVIVIMGYQAAKLQTGNVLEFSQSGLEVGCHPPGVPHTLSEQPESSLSQAHLKHSP